MSRAALIKRLMELVPRPVEPKRYLVLAGSHQQYARWCREHEYDIKMVVYIQKWGDIMGRYAEDGWELVKVGTWYDRPAHEKVAIIEQLMAHGFEV